MQRVLVSGSAFKCSAPGYNVTTATGTQLVFDAFANNAYNGVFLSGTVASSQMVGSGNYFKGTVNFGKTYPSPPQVLYNVILGSNNNLLRDYAYTNATGSTGTRVVATTTTTNFTLEVYSTGSGFVNNPGFAFLVMQV